MLQGLRVLVVEDELLVAINLETMLSEAGCFVLGPLGSLETALHACEVERPDVAILDINLRGEEVYPAAERLREKNIPIVFCSGYTDLGTLPEGFRDCVRLGKPYDTGDITRAIVRALEQAERGRGAAGNGLTAGGS